MIPVNRAYMSVQFNHYLIGTGENWSLDGIPTEVDHSDEEPHLRCLPVFISGSSGPATVPVVL